MKIELLQEEHYSAVAEIYAQGIATGIATFETECPSWESWNNAHLAFGRLGLWEDRQLMGWAALSPVSDRCVYNGVAEVSVYVGTQFRGKGIGKILLQELIANSEMHNIWTLQSAIMQPNTASIQLHLKCGFREIGYRERVGHLNGKWFDNVLMERRSSVVGI
ncbi:GNAT family N-acetyltransferase [Membranihabitans marinus]|uniref:GNAT family N-acetyltransferase n=1 Tax=Membranihabitans marinus TaxID=1227546 RepID=UPI001F248219|nr:GNAT family N-acetyltransferase [Membranihabitans marinus]